MTEGPAPRTNSLHASNISGEASGSFDLDGMRIKLIRNALNTKTLTFQNVEFNSAWSCRDARYRPVCLSVSLNVPVRLVGDRLIQCQNSGLPTASTYSAIRRRSLAGRSMKRKGVSEGGEAGIVVERCRNCREMVSRKNLRAENLLAVSIELSSA